MAVERIGLVDTAILGALEVSSLFSQSVAASSTGETCCTEHVPTALESS